MVHSVLGILVYKVDFCGGATVIYVAWLGVEKIF